MNLAMDWRKEAGKLSFRDKAFIGGRFVPAASGATYDCISPVDGKLLAKIAAGDREDVDRAVKAARAAFNSGTWADQPPKSRKRTLLKLAELIAAHADELALLETLDMGKPIKFAKNVDINAVVECVRWYAEAIDKIYDEIAPTATDSLALVTREPLGVGGAGVPWNFPLLMAAWKFAPALAMGNSVIVKPAEQSPLSVLRVAELAAEAGIPEGVFNVVPGFGETAGQALGRHMEVDAVAFTGSTEVGKLFLKYSGESNMKIVSLECGGKTPNIVFADAPDLEAAAAGAAEGIFFNSGQVCSAASRLLVEEKIHDAFVDKVKALAAVYQPGDPLDPKTLMGSMVDRAQMDRVLGYIEKGKQEGAALAAGGRQVRQNSGGFYIEPTVFDRVTGAMTIAREEIFGPVLSTLTFRNAEEAVKIANDTIYGLSGSLWTNDLKRGLRVAQAIKTGVLSVNSSSSVHLQGPFGGYRQSGLGRELGMHALEHYSELRNIYFET
ncbi:MAG: aldehyde dehydrogenase [Deltaproteobacteria bacterium]|nr:aldehyde dehydrogenase [Deltaproteobacteria bacterium]